MGILEGDEWTQPMGDHFVPQPLHDLFDQQARVEAVLFSLAGLVEMPACY
jgi:hypothetical protein